MAFTTIVTTTKDQALLREVNRSENTPWFQGAPLLDHLIELRKRLIICLFAIGVAFFICFAFATLLFQDLAVIPLLALGCAGVALFDGMVGVVSAVLAASLLAAPPAFAQDLTAGAVAGQFAGALELLGEDLAGSDEERDLIRRATLDLTGLPPTPEELGSFLANPSGGKRAELVPSSAVQAATVTGG